jgi:hypothetical protein
MRRICVMELFYFHSIRRSETDIYDIFGFGCLKSDIRVLMTYFQYKFKLGMETETDIYGIFGFDGVLNPILEF